MADSSIAADVEEMSLEEKDDVEDKIRLPGILRKKIDKKKSPSTQDATAVPKATDALPAKITAVDKYRYDMNHKKRGKLHVFANYFADSPDNERKGTDVDYSAVYVTFRKLGFTVERHPDTKAMEMHRLMQQFAAEDYEDSDCFAAFIMTHGSDAVPLLKSGKLLLLSADNKSVFFDDLVEPIRNSAKLINKPKLFFIQACRGTEKDDGWRLAKDGHCPENKKIPREADFLYAYATPPGYVSWRNTGGSWFVQSLCKVLEDTADDNLDLLRILTRVCNMVSVEYASDANLEKQAPCIVSTLTKELYFTTKE